MVIMAFIVLYLYKSEVSPKDEPKRNNLWLAISIFVKGSQSTTLRHLCHLPFSVLSVPQSK